MLNIAILDTDAWVCKGITDYFSTPGIKTFSCPSLDELNQLLEKHTIQILVAELMTEENDLTHCVNYLREFARRYPEVRLVIYTHLTDPALIKFLLQYVPFCTLMLKRDPILRLASCIFSRNGGDGNVYSSPAEVWKAIRAQKEILTPREFALLSQFAGGQSYKVIARDIDLSTKTISYYKQRIMTKLGCHNTADLQRRMYGFGLLKPQVSQWELRKSA